jgi:hypothetical protein
MNNETFGERGNGVVRESCGIRSHDVLAVNHMLAVKLNLRKVGLRLQQYEIASTLKISFQYCLPFEVQRFKCYHILGIFLNKIDITENLLLNGRSFT